MNKKTLVVAFTYVGTIIGAGFASGQEIKKFFVDYGLVGFIAFIFAAFMFYYLGKKIMIMGNTSHAESYNKILTYAFTCKARKFFDYAIIFFLMCTATIMASGMGASLNQNFGIPNFVGCLIMVGISIGFVFWGFEKIMKLSFVVIPALIVSTLLIASNSFFNIESFSFISENSPGTIGLGFFSGVLYVSYNIMMSLSILPILGNSLSNEKEIDYSAKLAGIIILIVGLIICFAIFLNYASLSGVEVPLLSIANNSNIIFSLLYFISFIIAVSTTSISTLYGLFVRVNKKKIPFFIIVGIVFISSLFGFSVLVKTLYTFMGYMGIFIIAMLFYGFSKRKVRYLPSGKNNQTNINKK